MFSVHTSAESISYSSYSSYSPPSSFPCGNSISFPAVRFLASPDRAGEPPASIAFIFRTSAHLASHRNGVRPFCFDHWITSTPIASHLHEVSSAPCATLWPAAPAQPHFPRGIRARFLNRGNREPVAQIRRSRHVHSTRAHVHPSRAHVPITPQVLTCRGRLLSRSSPSPPLPHSTASSLSHLVAHPASSSCLPPRAV
jgi:hypothetical protein